ncbi:MAG TPA: hypothetical protein VMW58_09305 [Anaerolineae bacterium]|nr:hypothetical protein [Anaerolineae bacterium]
MSIDANRLAEQIKLAYEFMETLHGQAIALIKDVEGQVAQAAEELRCLRPGGNYRFAATPMSYSLERPQTAIADYYAVYFRHFPDRVKNALLDGDVPPICFLKVVLRERRLEHPEARFGVMTEIAKPPERGDKFPHKFEELINDPITSKALAGPAWSTQHTISQNYQHSYISMAIRGMGVRLADLPDSEAIAVRIVEPLLELYREAVG